jgi:hypothetical protein
MEDDLDGITQNSSSANDTDKDKTGRESKKNKATNANTQVADFGSAILQSVDAGLKLVTKMMENNKESANTNSGITGGQGGGGVVRALTYASSQMASILGVIETLQEKEDTLKEDENSECPRVQQRLKVTQMALERAYKDLEEASK